MTSVFKCASFSICAVLTFVVSSCLQAQGRLDPKAPYDEIPGAGIDSSGASYRVLSPACDGKTISRIEINTFPPFQPETFKILTKTARLLTRIHVTTKESVIRRYLALDSGQVCTEIRRKESERILRAQPFLADAEVIAVSDSLNAQTVTLYVKTVDEISLVLGGQLTSKSPMVKQITVGESNLEGGALSAVAGWKHSANEYRDAFHAKLIHYQFFGRPYHFSAEGRRNQLGSSWELQASHPYITDLQRISWRITSGSINGYQHFVRSDNERTSLNFRRDYNDIGGLFALGPPGKLILLGASISTEKERTDFFPVIVSDSGLLSDTSSVLVGRYGQYVTSRANLLFGYRDVNLVRVTGFDALAGVQDIRTGLQISGLFGKGFKILDGADDDYFLSLGIYLGVGGPKSFLGFESTTERRKDVDAAEWDGILASSRTAWYHKITPTNTLVSSLEFSGGWRQRVPFQLTFRDKIGGLRGYSRSNIAGGQRMVLRVEDRFPIGRVRDLATWGGAVFMDAGRMWAGDAPFGATTKINASVGVSLLAALPPNSRRVWRMDIAVPVSSEGRGSKLELRFRTYDNTRLFWREPEDVQVGRERSVPHSVYSWP